jgi:hypothetical protein
VTGTVGRSTWPEMRTQPVPCGSLLQSDGTRYLVMEPYSCAHRQREAQIGRIPPTETLVTLEVTVRTQLVHKGFRASRPNSTSTA